ncbi:hypothetical protein GCM10028807_17500 [Spirosoma daeguense]
MNTNSNVQDELSTLERLLAPTPVYFRAIQIMAIILGAIGAVIYQLASVTTLPEWVQFMGDRATLAVEFVLIFFPQLAVDFKALAKKKELELIR